MLPAGFERFCSSKLAKSLKGNYVPPSHTLSSICARTSEDICEDLQSSFRQSVLALKVSAGRLCAQGDSDGANSNYISARLTICCSTCMTCSPVRDADVLARALRQRYVAALIDEFQDTDPLQYDIFQRLFSGESTRSRQRAEKLRCS